MQLSNAVAVFTLFAAMFPAAAQQDSVRTAAPVTDLGAAANLPAQPVGPDDLINVQLYDAPEVSRSVRVSAEGTIRLSLLQNPIRVEGLLPKDIEVMVGDAYKREKVFVDPDVTVTIVEYHSRPISVAGAVRNPIVFQAVGPVSLIDAIGKAGGLIPDQSGPEILVTRPNGDTGTQSVQRVPVKALFSGSAPELNLKLTGGELIRVPDVGKITVGGNVNHPGVFPVIDGTENTVITAIAQAQGTAQYFSNTAYLFRPDGNGGVREIPIPLGEILKRKKPDMTLQARDVLFIPDSTSKRFSDNAVKVATQTAGGIGLALLYVLR